MRNVARSALWLAMLGACVGDLPTLPANTARCGDGVVRTDLDPEEDYDAERCDDGNDDNKDVCSLDCNPDDHGNYASTGTRIRLHEPMPGYLEDGDYADSNDTFVYTAQKDGLHTFFAENGASPTLSDTDCQVDNDSGRTLARDTSLVHCRMEVAMHSGQTVYLDVTSPDPGNYTVHVKGPCGNGVIEDHEECDYNANGEWDTFSCRQDCRIRRTLTLGVDTSCSLDDGTAYCWGSSFRFRPRRLLNPFGLGMAWA